jgi:hypothetical protein
LSNGVVSVRSIERIFEIHCPDEACLTQLKYLQADPIMEFEPSSRTEIYIKALGNGFYDLNAPWRGGPGNALHMKERVHSIIHSATVAETDDCPVIHGGCMRLGEHRLIAVGSKGAGKTTLMLKCLLKGFAIEGDEHVVIKPDGVLARPRTLRVKAKSIDLLPELKSQILNSPKTLDWDGGAIFAFSPQLTEHIWSIKNGHANAILILKPNHGGLSSLKPIGASSLFDNLLEQVYLPISGKGRALATLHSLTRRTKAFELRIGNLDGAVALLERLCAVR